MTLEQEQTVSFSIIKAEPYAFLDFLLQMVISQFLIFLYAWIETFNVRKSTEKPNYVNESFYP